MEEPHNWISAAPDWVCGILSPATAQVDRTEKMPIYAQHGVLHAWLIDPILKTLEIFRFQPGSWVVPGAYAKSAKVHAEPFSEIELDLGLLWLERGNARLILEIHSCRTNSFQVLSDEVLIPSSHVAVHSAAHLSLRGAKRRCNLEYSKNKIASLRSQ